MDSGLGSITWQSNALHYNYFVFPPLQLQLQLHFFHHVMHYITVTLLK